MIKLWNYRHISVGNMVRNSIQSCFFSINRSTVYFVTLGTIHPFFLFSDAG